MDPNNYAKTIFCDIDGTIFVQCGTLLKICTEDPQILPGAVEAFQAWNDNGYTVIITTGRPESTREITHKQIVEAGLFYDQLIMGLPRGQRIVINDTKPHSPNYETVRGISPQRDEGLLNCQMI